ncbi:MAG TPA: hypothetical protein VNZ43_15725 [Sphingomonadaceae bacterium]|nr:hypothetical protein [Sphingomonadaceae bacterium]
MKIGRILLPLAALAAVSTPAAAQAPGEISAAPDRSCDRDCLIGSLHAYMAALAARTPSVLPLAHDVMFTENDVVLPLGKGLWGTVTAVDAHGLELADPETGNAAWFGSVRENGKPAIFALRLHLRNGRIDEIETVVHRKTALPAPFGDVTKLEHDPAFQEILPPEQRRSRARLIAIADSYFNTVERNDGQVFAPFDEDCGRLENGISTTSGSASSGNAAAIAQGCEAQFKLGIYLINKRVRERRFPLVDVERGVVVASGFFDHANEFDHYKLTDGREMKTALKWPNSITLLEAFRIKDGKIHRIEAVFTYVPYFMHNPWAGPAATPPSHEPDPAACNDACLSGLAGQVMDAYVSREWQALPWAKEVGYAENSVGLQVGEGIWGTVTARDKQPLVIADSQTGKAVWIGGIEEHGQPAWAAITVTASGDRIGGIDALIHRSEYGPPWTPPSTLSFPTLAKASRMPRNAMLTAVERFYDAVNRHDAAPPADLAEKCNWVVNGQTLSPCAQPFTTGALGSLDRVRDRQVLAVDEARGLVAVSTFEDFAATGQKPTAAAGYPRTLQVVELFRFANGKLQRVEAFTSELPFGMSPHR